MEWLLIALTAMAGSFLQATSGIGYAILTMAIWPMFLPFKEASILQVITAFGMVVYIGVKLFRHINIKLMIFPLISSLALSTLGVIILMASSDTFMKRILGVTLMILAVYFVFISERIKLRPTKLNGLIAGGISGFLSGFFNVGGPPIVAYFLSVTEDKMEYNATLNGYYFFTTVYVFIMHLALGNVSFEVIKLSVIGLTGVVAGTAGGMFIFKKLKMSTIRKLVYAFTAIAGLYLVIKG